MDDPNNSKKLNLRKIDEMRKTGELEKYLGKYIALVDGNVVDGNHNLEELWGRVCYKYPDKVKLIHKVKWEC